MVATRFRLSKRSGAIRPIACQAPLNSSNSAMSDRISGVIRRLSTLKPPSISSSNSIHLSCHKHHPFVHPFPSNKQNSPTISTITQRARCVLYYNTILGRGPASRAPVPSPRLWPSFSIELHSVQPTRIAGLIHSQGRLRFSPVPHRPARRRWTRPRGLRAPVEP